MCAAIGVIINDNDDDDDDDNMLVKNCTRPTPEPFRRLAGKIETGKED